MTRCRMPSAASQPQEVETHGLSSPETVSSKFWQVPLSNPTHESSTCPQTGLSLVYLLHLRMEQQRGNCKENAGKDAWCIL